MSKKTKTAIIWNCVKKKSVLILFWLLMVNCWHVHQWVTSLGAVRVCPLHFGSHHQTMFFCSSGPALPSERGTETLSYPVIPQTVCCQPDSDVQVPHNWAGGVVPVAKLHARQLPAKSTSPAGFPAKHRAAALQLEQNQTTPACFTCKLRVANTKKTTGVFRSC